MRSQLSRHGLRTRSARTVGLVLSVFVGVSCHGGGGAAPPSAAVLPVTAVPVVEESVRERVEVVGRIGALATVDVFARVSGVLEERAFREGDMVEKGQRLFTIERRPYEIAVASSKAAVEAAAAAHQQAKQFLDRLESVREGGVAPNELENARLEERRMFAQLESARASLDSAELQLGFTLIHAEITGRVGISSLDTGNLVSQQSGALVRIHQIDPIEARFFVPESVYTRNETARRAAGVSLAEHRKSFEIRLRLSDGTMYSEVGEFTFIDNEVDQSTGTIELRARFPNAQGVLLPGQFVTMVIGVGQETEQPVVPRSAVLQDRSGLSVMVINSNGAAERRPVTLGPEIGRNVSVLEGLAVGEQVITEGLDRLRPGMKVEVHRGPGNEVNDG